MSNFYNDFDKDRNLIETIAEEPSRQQVMAGTRIRKKKRKAGKAIALGLSGVLIGSLGLGTGVAIGSRIPAPGAAVAVESASEGMQSGGSTVNYAPTALGLSDSDVVSVIKKVQDSVVSISITAVNRDIFNRTYESSGAGSGIIFQEDDENVYIVTNHHVISDANSVTVSIDDSTLVSASYVGSDKQSDVAVISVSKADMSAAGVTNYTIATFGNADAMEVGETVIAIGNAYGEGKSATLGIVSAKDKEITVDSDTTLKVMQTDAAINPGNSGGALVNMSGQVIGINTAKLSSSDAEGMGYSITSNIVKDIIDEIMVSGSVERPYIGITGQTVTEEMKEVYSLPATGVYVVEVSSSGGQYLSELRSGDIIVGCNGQTITTMEELQERIGQANVGDTLTLSIYRNNRMGSVEVEVRNYNKEANF